MFEILSYERLTPNIFMMDIYAPRVASHARPGQFVICIAVDHGERIPLTICDYDENKGSVTIVVQEIGASTVKMGKMKVGQRLTDFVGPLGRPSEFTEMDIDELKEKRIVFVAGGVGTAPVYPQVKWLKERGIDSDVIIGAKNKSLVILEDKFKAVAKNLYITTDDGSYGFKGMVTDRLSALISDGKNYDLCISIGPMIMMKFVSKLTEQLGIKTIVSLNPIMVDGTGMCGACRVMVGGEVKFACVDGPEFDGHLVDYDGAMKRQSIYKTEEGKAYLKEIEGNTHSGGCGICRGDE